MVKSYFKNYMTNPYFSSSCLWSSNLSFSSRSLICPSMESFSVMYQRLISSSPFGLLSWRAKMQSGRMMFLSNIIDHCSFVSGKLSRIHPPCLKKTKQMLWMNPKSLFEFNTMANALLTVLVVTNLSPARETYQRQSQSNNRKPDQTKWFSNECGIEVKKDYEAHVRLIRL